jgi:hypothetical protein
VLVLCTKTLKYTLNVSLPVAEVTGFYHKICYGQIQFALLVISVAHSVFATMRRTETGQLLRVYLMKNL